MFKKDLKYFFVERMVELLNRNSIDSYRVRCNNVFSLIKELRGVVDNWLRGYVKQFETVCLCIEETLEAMKEDGIIDYSFYDKQLMIDDLTDLRKADQKNRGELGNQSIYLLDKCIHCNQDTYLERLFDAISKIFFSDDELSDAEFKPWADQLDRLASALACELLNEGFSLSHLYRESRKLIKEFENFENAFNDFRQKHGHNVPLNQYEVVLKMNGGKNKRLTTLSGFSDSLPDSFVPDRVRDSNIDKFLSSRGVMFYRCRVEAHDSSMAITLAIEQMETVVDMAILGYSVLDVVVQKTALVVLRSSSGDKFLTLSVQVSDACYADNDQVVSAMIDNIERIKGNGNIVVDVKDRLTSSLRHLRIGNSEADTGQQLVNYWVALEFIFSSPKAIDSTIPRMEKNLINVLLCCYARRRVSHLNDMLHKNGTLDVGDNWWSLDDQQLDALIGKQSSQLARYHLQQMKAALRNTKDAAKAFFSEHKKHLYWQIYRIYRYRNKLIHEAAILPGLDNVIRCQRFYLVLLLNQLIGYFSKSSSELLSMDSFFFEYAQKSNLLHNILLQEKTGVERISELMRIEVYSELIRPSGYDII